MFGRVLPVFSSLVNADKFIKNSRLRKKDSNEKLKVTWTSVHSKLDLVLNR